MADLVEELEENYRNNRGEVLRDDGNVSTPITVLREMAKDYGISVHMEIHELHITKNTRAYQVEMYVGNMRGRGESSRRKLAMQISAADLLKRMKIITGFDVPVFAMVPGCRISPYIFGDLLALCKALELTDPLYINLPQDPEVQSEHLYMYKCQIGQLILIGSSDSEYLAKRWAAKKMFETLTGKMFPLDTVAYGANCDLLEKYKIVPNNSKKKLDILKYRAESRNASKGVSAGSTVGSTSVGPVNVGPASVGPASVGPTSVPISDNEDDFCDEMDDDSPSLHPNPNQGETEERKERMQHIWDNVGQLKQRMASLQLNSTS